VLASVLHTQAEVVEVAADGDGVGDRVPHLTYASDVVEVVGTWLYRPGIRLFGLVVAHTKRLQSGRLDAYLLYMLIALVAVIAVVTALA
jgi:hydrogenase-4 component B